MWHVHGSWTTAFVQGPHTYLVPVTPDRGPDGLGRARTWDWPESVVEVPPERLRDEDIDLVILQRPHELDLVDRWLAGARRWSTWSTTPPTATCPAPATRPRTSRASRSSTSPTSTG